MMETSNDPVIEQLYGRYRYLFYVHLKNQSITIKSDLINKRGFTTEAIAREKTYSTNWVASYERTRGLIAAQIGEVLGKPPENDPVEQSYRSLIESVNFLIGNLHLDLESELSIKKVYEHAATLRNLSRK